MAAQLDVSHVGERGILMTKLLIHLRNGITNCETVTREFYESNDVIKFENLKDRIGTWDQYIISKESTLYADYVWQEFFPHAIYINEHDIIELSFNSRGYYQGFEVKKDRIDWKKEGF